MSEIYPSVRASIRDSVTRILFDRPGKWLTTHDLLNHCEEAETSDTLAKILSDMAKTGRLERGLKTLNAQGREVNTWGLSPRLRDKIMSGQLMAQSLELLAKYHDAGHDAAAPPLPAESIEDEAPGTTASAPYTGDPLDKRPYAPIPWPAVVDDAPDSAPTPDKAALAADPPIAVPPSTWHLAESDQPIETPQPIQETEILCAHLPERWLPDLRLRLIGDDARDDPVITLRVCTEGGGAYLTLSTQGKIPFDPGELDFLPSVGNALCKFVDALYPYGVKSGAASLKPGE